MKVSVKDPNHHEFIVVDMNTGSPIPFIQEANDETGEFTMILPKVDENGDFTWIERINERGEWKLIEFRFRGNIKIFKKDDIRK